MKKYIHILSCAIASALMTSCGSCDVRESVVEQLSIFPDYKDVTVPYNIAPLNFMTDQVQKGKVKVETEGGERMTRPLKDGKVTFPIRRWHSLLESAKGGKLILTVVDSEGKAYDPFFIHVAEEPVDRYVAYRLIEPGYKLWNEMGIYQRNLENFRQTAVLENRDVNYACVNCHSFADRDPETMALHVRKTEYGGTYVSIDGRFEKLDTKTPQTISALVYPSWHTSRKYIAFSVNSTAQTFHVSDPNKIEVFDTESDVVVYDVEKRKLLTSMSLFSKSSFETFPSFSNDGSKLYYCTADSLKMPTSYKSLKYSLCSIGFDPETVSFGKVDTLIRAGNESVTMPRMSPDGRYMLYTSTAYGNFTVWHKDADLVLVDLESGERHEAAGWNSDEAESYHSWSGNSRWVVFSTRRTDGDYTRLCLGYIAPDGTLGKAFLLPQRDPEQNMRLMKSYNIPEFASDRISPKGYAVRNASDSYQVEFAGSYRPEEVDAATGASAVSVN